MAQFFRSTLFWACVAYLGIGILWTVVRIIRIFQRKDDELTPKDFLQLIGLLLLLSAVAFPIAFTLDHLLPDYEFFHGTDENGDSFDRRDGIGILISLPITYLLIRGFHALRKDRKRRY